MIRLAVATYDNTAPAAPMSAQFGPVRRNIGRAEDNHFVLPDASNQVARIQAAVWSDGVRHFIATLSDATPVLVNGQELASGAETALQLGDQVAFGPYVLRVEEADNQANAEVEALKQAFLRGAGLAPDAISSELTPELMELAGKLLATSLQGAIDLLALRSLVKQEVKADVTMVVVRNNNPLKFFPDSQTVLTQMLRKKMPGFMEPMEAVEHAFSDLRGHQMGIVAGTRASMDTMMWRLRPARFEEEHKPGGVMDSLLPSRRPAALWALYQQKHGQLSAEAKDPFKSVFGAAFLSAYEDEVDRFNKKAQK
jgi:predicted component of type VI protein secretion system